jgi:hypothetical protein
MDAGIRRLSAEGEHAYGVHLRGQLVAHVWWDADPDRRAAAGWYVRDLRTPAVVVRLALAGGAPEALAADAGAEADAWIRAAEAVARRSTLAALDEAREGLGDSRFESYDVHVGGLGHAALVAAFPDLGLRADGEIDIVSGRFDGSALADVLGLVRALGGTVTAVVRVRPRLR